MKLLATGEYLRQSIANADRAQWPDLDAGSALLVEYIDTCLDDCAEDLDDDLWIWLYAKCGRLDIY